MFLVNEETRQRRPVVRCEHCQTAIERGEEGRAVWEPPERSASPYVGVRFVHAGCLDGYTAEPRAEVESSELGAFVRDLAWNLKLLEEA